MFNLLQVQVQDGLRKGQFGEMKFSVSEWRTENGIVIKEGKSGEYGVGTWLGYQLSLLQLVAQAILSRCHSWNSFTKRGERLKAHPPLCLCCRSPEME